MLKSLVYRFLGDFVKDHPLWRIGALVPVGGGLEVPGNSLAFPVRVGGQKYIRCFRTSLFQVVDYGPLVLHYDVRGLKVLFDVHSNFALGQVTNMALGSGYDILISQDLAHGSCLGWGLHNYQALTGGAGQRRALSGAALTPACSASFGLGFGPPFSSGLGLSISCHIYRTSPAYGYSACSPPASPCLSTPAS